MAELIREVSLLINDEWMPGSGQGYSAVIAGDI